MHLIIDGYTDSPDVLQSEEFIYTFLDSYPAQINMTKITKPKVVKYVGPQPDEWGISGFVMIAESHISVHTFAELGYVNIDIFSCKDFDAEQISRDIRQRFSLYEIQTHLLGRGVAELGRPRKAKIAFLK